MKINLNKRINLIIINGNNLIDDNSIKAIELVEIALNNACLLSDNQLSEISKKLINDSDITTETCMRLICDIYQAPKYIKKIKLFYNIENNSFYLKLGSFSKKIYQYKNELNKKTELSLKNLLTKEVWNYEKEVLHYEYK